MVTEKDIPAEQINDFSNDITGFLTFVTQTNPLLHGWSSKNRDKQLRTYTAHNPFLASIVNLLQVKLFGLPFKVIPSNSEIASHISLANYYNNVLQQSINSDFEKVLSDLLICDQGAFIYIQASEASDKPLSKSVPTKLKHLDSVQCSLTGDAEFPVVYHHSDNSKYKIHHSRLIHLVSFPSGNREMLGVGYSFVSRAFELVTHLLDISTYESEVLGSRSSSELITVSGATSRDLEEAFQKADLEAGNAGLKRTASRVLLGMKDPNAKLNRVPLKSLPDQFQKRDDIEITLMLMAIAAGVSGNTIYDSVKSSSTRSSAEESTRNTKAMLFSWFQTKICRSLNEKFLPRDGILNTICVDEQEYDKNKSAIALNLSRTRDANLKNNTTTLRVERQRMLANNNLTQAQFDALELEDGRLPNGLSIEALFSTTNKTIRDMIYVVENPLDIENNDKEEVLIRIEENLTNAMRLALESNSGTTQKWATQAIAALKWLREQYTNSEVPIENNEPVFTTVESRDIQKTIRKVFREYWNGNNDFSTTFNTLADIYEDNDEALELVDSAMDKIATKENGVLLKEITPIADELAINLLNLQ